MNLLNSKGKLITAVIIALLLLGGVADAIAVTKFGFDQGNPFSGRGSNEISNSPAQMVIQTSTLEPTPTLSATPTPTPVPPLNSQLKEALSVDGNSARGAALLEVAQHAVLQNDYWTAIRAASATPYNSEQAVHLSFVVRCAIEDGEYRLAAEAANQIKYNSVRDLLKIEVIEARRLATFELDRLRYERASRISMACFSSLSK